MISTLFGLNKYLIGGVGLVILALGSVTYVQSARLSAAQDAISEQQKQIVALKQESVNQQSRIADNSRTTQSYSGVLSLAEIQKRLEERRNEAATNTVTVTVNDRLRNPYAANYGR